MTLIYTSAEEEEEKEEEWEENKKKRRRTRRRGKKLTRRRGEGERKREEVQGERKGGGERGGGEEEGEGDGREDGRGERKSSSSWRVDGCCPLRRLSAMSTFLRVLPHLSPTGWGSLADLLYPCPPGTPRRSSPLSTRTIWPVFVATTCSSAWCAGVVASSLTTWP